MTDSYSMAIAPMTTPIRAPGTFRAAAPPMFGTLVALPVEVAVDEALEAVVVVVLLLEVAEADAEADEDEAEAEAELDAVDDAAAEEDEGVVVVIRVVDDAALLPVEEAEADADVPVAVAEVTLAVPEAPVTTKRGRKFTSLGSESSVMRMVKSGCAARSAGTVQVKLPVLSMWPATSVPTCSSPATENTHLRW